MENITRKYKVEGMSAPKSFTLFEQNDHCWATSGLPDEEYKNLFFRAKNEDRFWSDNTITATVECDDIGVHGSPINGVVKKIEIQSKL